MPRSEPQIRQAARVLDEEDVTMREVLDAAAERIDQASKDGGRFAGGVRTS